MTKTTEDVNMSVDDVLSLVPARGAVVICYNTAEIWNDREAAKDFYTEAAFFCEGAERDRYMEVLYGLGTNEPVCCDGVSTRVFSIERRERGDWY